MAPAGFEPAPPHERGADFKSAASACSATGPPRPDDTALSIGRISCWLREFLTALILPSKVARFFVGDVMQVLVALDEIKDKGRSFTQPLPVEFLSRVLDGFGHATGYVARGPSTFAAHVSRTSGAFELSGKLSVPLRGECKRCLKPVDSDVPVEFRLNLVSTTRVPAKVIEDDPSDLDHTKGTFGLDDADEEVVEGGVVDLLDVAREQILLAVPADLVCSETCLGLCPRCGKNLNEGECSCPGPDPDPRWAALKGLKLN
jgi:uncharacterized protein